MGKMNLKAALWYQLDYMAKATLSVFGVLVLIAIAAYLLSAFGILNITISDYAPNDVLDLAMRGAYAVQNDDGYYTNITMNIGAVALLSLFIVGIVGIREDIKFLLQNGMGRRTVFTCTFLASIITAVVLGFFGELFNLISYNWSVFSLRGLTLDATNHTFLLGWLFHIAVLFMAWQLGTFVSLIYYRLNKIGQIVFSISAVSAFILMTSLSAQRITADVDVWVENFIYAIENINLINVSTITFLIGLVTAALSFLLIRRAQTKE